ncbi:hypothetical protein PC9H_006161 [Pleurotus ostreatus]|uniref:carboxypeptidase C n=1 Tax=Pleurotus ostreatus TaxID=5322 RepID=A0A8H6ZTK8_PLEOS|nr:uncharacterized protein PC9H_006161 [Pleurotus ostreatus]KAF7430454.1 hypothetical protein PC9H_006161 [Pleurotus ostreatus]
MYPVYALASQHHRVGLVGKLSSRDQKRHNLLCHRTTESSLSALRSLGMLGHLFFYFFESRSDPDTDDVLLWTNGGPGGSSVVGLLTGLGSRRMLDASGPKYHPESWNSKANIFFIDQPVGTGFSYAEYGEAAAPSIPSLRMLKRRLKTFPDAEGLHQPHPTLPERTRHPRAPRGRSRRPALRAPQPRRKRRLLQQPRPPAPVRGARRGVRVLRYAETYDWVANWAGNERWALDTAWRGQEEFNKQALREWAVDGRVAGKTRSSGGLTFATVEATGHMAPCDKPKETLAILLRWLSAEAL